MNVSEFSTVTDLLYGTTGSDGLAWADAKAFVVARSADPDAATVLENNKTSGANLVAQGALALTGRAGWYSASMFAYTLPDLSTQPPGLNPVGAAGDAILVNANGNGFVLGSAGGGLSLGAFGSSPNADGASFGSGTLTLQPADTTHPGGVAAAAQDFGNFNRTFWGMTFRGDFFGSGPCLKFADGAEIGSLSGSPTVLWGNSGGNGLILYDGISFIARYSFKTAGVDMSGCTAGAGIKMTSPDGTVYTLTIANGGTVHVA
jgi:hypothetical protein